MEFLGLSFWAVIGIVALLGYIFLIGIVSSVVFLDNVLPRIPPQIETPERVRAKHVAFSEVIGGLEPIKETNAEDFEVLITNLATGSSAGKLDDVRRLYNSGDFIGAISKAAAITIANPKNVEALRLLSRTLDRIGEYERAVIVWDELYNNIQIDEEIATRRIRIRYSLNEFEACISACEQLLDSKINDLLAYEMIGKSLINLKKYEDSLPIWEKIEQLSPNQEVVSKIDRLMFTLNKFEDLILRISERGDVQELGLDDLRLLSRAEMKSQNFDPANTLEKLAVRTQDDDDWYEVARIHFNKKRYDQSLIASNEVLRISPINEKGLQLKIRTLMILDKDLEAIDVLKQLKNTVGMDSNLLLKEAALNFKIGNFSEAEMSYRTVWDEQNDISAARGIIRCLIREERFGATISFIDSIGITLDENIVVNKLHCLYKLQRFEQVMIVYERNKDLIQKNPKILRFAAMAQKSMGFLEESLSLWHKLLDFDAERLTANLAISGIAYDLHDNEKALFFLLKVLDEDPTNESALWLSSQIDIREKNWDGAISTLTQLKLEYPTNIKYWRSHISTLYRINQKELAEEIFRDAVEKFGNELEYKTQLIELAEEFLWPDFARKLCTEIVKNSSERIESLLQLVETYYSIGYASTASRFAMRVKQLDLESFQQSEIISKLLNLLDRANITLEECGGNAFWGQWDEEIYNIQLVAKAIVLETATERVGGNRSKNMAMVSSSIGRGGAERQMVFCLNNLEQDKNIEYDVELFLHSNSNLNLETTYFGELNKKNLVINTFGGKKGADYINHKLYPNFKRWEELIAHVPDSHQNYRNLVTMYYGFLEGDYELIHAWQDLTNVIAAMAAMMAGVPKILLSARSMSPNQKTMLHMRTAGFLRGAYNEILKADGVVLCHNSEAGAQSYKQWFGMNSFDFPVLQNGTNFEQLVSVLSEDEQQNIQRLIDWKRNRLVVGTVFRFVPEKQPLLWIDIARSVLTSREDICFVMVGDGPLFEAAKEKANKLGIVDSIYFAGLSKSVGNWLQEFDLFLLCSSIEGLPNVLIEAQGFGVPVISTNAGGAAEVVTDGETGFIVNNYNTTELANKIIWAADNEKWRKDASKKSWGGSRSMFSVDAMYERLLRLYDEI